MERVVWSVVALFSKFSPRSGGLSQDEISLELAGDLQSHVELVDDIHLLLPEEFGGKFGIDGQAKPYAVHPHPDVCRLFGILDSDGRLRLSRWRAGRGSILHED